MKHIEAGNYALTQTQQLSDGTLVVVQVGRLFAVEGIEYWFLYQPSASFPSGWGAYQWPHAPRSRRASEAVAVQLTFSAAKFDGNDAFPGNYGSDLPAMQKYVSYLDGARGSDGMTTGPGIKAVGVQGDYRTSDAASDVGGQNLKIWGAPQQVNWGFYAVSQDTADNLVGYVYMPKSTSTGGSGSGTEYWALCTKTDPSAVIPPDPVVPGPIGTYTPPISARVGNYICQWLGEEPPGMAPAYLANFTFYEATIACTSTAAAAPAALSFVVNRVVPATRRS